MKCKLVEENCKQQVCGDIIGCILFNNLGVNQVQFVVMFIIMNWPEISNMKLYFNLHICDLRGVSHKVAMVLFCHIL